MWACGSVCGRVTSDDMTGDMATAQVGQVQAMSACSKDMAVPDAEHRRDDQEERRE
jgi:hypothetical protein